MAVHKSKRRKRKYFKIAALASRTNGFGQAKKKPRFAGLPNFIFQQLNKFSVPLWLCIKVKAKSKKVRIIQLFIHYQFFNTLQT